MDNNGRECEEDLFEIIRHTEGGAPEGGAEDEGPITDGSEWLNETGDGIEPEQRDEAETSVDCDDVDSHNVGPAVTKSGEVY